MIISFVGDLSVTGKFKKSILDDTLMFDDEILTILKNSDYTVANLEGPATNHPVIFDKHVNVLSPLKAISYLHNFGINIFNLANNHTFDAGKKGFIECKNEIINNNCKYFGAGESLTEASQTLFIEKNGITIALIGIGASGSSKKQCLDSKEGVFSDMNMTLIKKRILHSKEKANWTIINIHSGTEFNFYPIDYIQNKLKNFIDLGANIIIGHHSHVPQGIEKYKDGIIFYSLGNFMFDIHGHKDKLNTDLSILPTIEFEKKSFRYNYILTNMEIENHKINKLLNKERKYKFERINKRTNSQYMTTFRFMDMLRNVFFNPFLFRRVELNLMMPITFFMKLAFFRKGDSRAILETLFDYVKLNFIFRILPGENYLTKEKEY